MFLMVMTSLVGCLSFVEDFSESPNDPVSVPVSLILPTAQLTGQYAVGGQIARFTSIWMQQHAGVSRQEAGTGRYQATENMAQETWEEQFYSGAMNDLYVLRELADEQENNYYSGIADLYLAYLLALTTDLFGEVPFDECFQPELTLTPRYQTGEELYAEVNALITSGITKLEGTAPAAAPSADDLIFGGSASAWVKFGYSLRARQLLHLSKLPQFDPAAVLAAAANGFTSNDDNALLYYGTAANEQNPMFVFDRDRAQDTRMGEYLVDLMNGLSDPRLPLYADLDVDSAYSGAPAGQETDQVSGLGDFWVSEDAPVALMTYSELLFIQAEVNLRQGNGDVAANAYNDGIRASMEFLGIDTAAIEAYLATEGRTAADLTLEKLIEQKYIALYQQPEVWFDWRRTGFPALQPASPNFTSGNIPRKFLVPESERLYNPNCTTCGNDRVINRVWWDVP